MRLVLLLIAFGLLLVESGGLARPVGKADAAAISVVPVSAARPQINFDTQVKPIFKSNCMPCHFSGGQMYDRLPFDKSATIKQLGTKVFTRIKNEDDRRMIEAFLTQKPE
jgi:hypothetical protein